MIGNLIRYNFMWKLMMENLSDKRRSFDSTTMLPTLVHYAAHNAPQSLWKRSRASSAPVQTDPELLLPGLKSLSIMILANALLQFSAYVTVSSATAYADHLGGTSVFAGLTIGVPNVLSGIVLIPLTRLDEGRYTRPLRVVCAALILGNILHGVAYRANFLYLILIGRLVAGIGYTGFMYVKRYCTDPRIVGVRRRTTLASWLVVGQVFGMSAGPFICGVFYKVGFTNEVFNGFTSPGWITSCIWVLFTVAIAVFFRDLPKPNSDTIEMEAVNSTSTPPVKPSLRTLTRPQWGVILCMCYASATFFFTLGSFESAIPNYTAVAYGYSPYAAGNFIALGGIATFPFLLLNIRYAPRFQDRVTLVAGSMIGFCGLFIALVMLLTMSKVPVGAFYVCWVLVALGFNLATTCTLSLLSKQMPGIWNGRMSLAIQYSNILGRLTGAVFGGAAVNIGMKNYIGILLGLVGLGQVIFMVLWKDLKSKKG
ncbi:major facilitator superfamily domain-containing protein [Roridomyces roridus]|uniref:Major facilitator superfamily domain-containing protein n=1 Tax=Roridomyces roridus TaxID=1738132 RepID=A0AAD7BHM2_9AGAR|nr:major facilitator superfamily domain-containing protein [Roridomyces roridus]